METTETDNLPALDNSDTNFLADPKAFEHGQRVAKLFAASALVPDTFKGKVADCFIALHTANRARVDPLFFMQHAYIVHGKCAVDGQYVIAVLNASGRYINGIEYKYEGEGDSRRCTAYGALRDGRVESGYCTVQQAKDAGWWNKNSNWKTLTDQMLAYRSATFLARKYCPHIIAGMQPLEEIMDINGVQVVKNVSSGTANLNAKIGE